MGNNLCKGSSLECVNVLGGVEVFRSELLLGASFRSIKSLISISKFKWSADWLPIFTISSHSGV